NVLWKPKIQISLFPLSCRRYDRRFCFQFRLHGVVELLLADGSVLHQGTVAVYVQYRFAELGFGLGKLAPGLVKGRLKRPRVDLKQQISCFDWFIFLVILRLQITSYLGPDARVDESL